MHVDSRWVLSALVAVDPVDELLAVAVAAIIARNRRPWWADALCREYPDVEWFPGLGQSTGPAKDVCSRCLVRDDCLTAAVELDEPAGVWAATSVADRRRLRRDAA